MGSSNSTEMAAQKPEIDSRVTFGVELEYILATVPNHLENPYPNDPREVDARILADHDSINCDIQRKLTEAGIPSTVQETTWWQPPTAEQLRNNWLLKTDVSVGGRDENDISDSYLEFGLEMSSPPYYYDEASRTAVTTVLKTLRNNYLVRVNETTGLHVHVGNGYNGLEWRIVRNLMAISWTYERQILLILPESRNANSYAKPLRESELGLRHPELTRLEFLERIIACVDQRKLFRELRAGQIGRLGFNINGLREPLGSKRTIEFRQHQGTLDPEEILHWIHICTKLVEKACFIKDEEALYERLRNDVEKPIGFGEENEVSTVDYLMWLGCPAQAYYYGRKMIANKDEVEQRIASEARRDAMDLAMERDILPEGYFDRPADDSGLDDSSDSSSSGEDSDYDPNAALPLGWDEA